MVTEKKEEQEEDQRREEVIASTPSLQPDFKPKGGITKAQLSKFQAICCPEQLFISGIVLQSSRIIEFCEGIWLGDGSGKSYSKDLKVSNEDPTIKIEESSISISDNYNQNNKQNNVAALFESKKHQKLHWGLDTKERWERKANM
ncbi:hypothetical protein CJ030_MR6G021592 [Morella rubra]|uniref:Uncharacterized protein n=1 Tax=Morella rubra TaxID=262757 RepID=A0A6A1VHD1_9ROSI|nr:hypothetical protein CJ030_MR6G021592 [Morella rubra]